MHILTEASIQAFAMCPMMMEYEYSEDDMSDSVKLHFIVDEEINKEFDTVFSQS